VAEPAQSGATSPRRLAVDRIGSWVVACGGLAIIASILGILLFIVIEIAPLTRGARVEARASRALPGTGDVALVADEHRTHVAALRTDGWLRVLRLDGGEIVAERRVVDEGGVLTAVRGEPGASLLTAATAAGQVVAVPVRWIVSFDDERRQVAPELDDPVVFELGSGTLGPFAARLDEDGGGAAVAIVGDGVLAAEQLEVRESFLDGGKTVRRTRGEAAAPADVTALVLEQEGGRAYGGTRSGRLVSWRLEDGSVEPPESIPADSSAVTALSLLIGDRSLVVGREDGSLDVWFEVRQDDDSMRLTRIRQLARHSAPVRLIAPSLRGKGFLAQDEAGQLGLYHSTSDRVLWQGASPVPRATALFWAPKTDAAFVAGAGQLAEIEVANPHPEVGLDALFGRVWYEGYAEPAYVWQSTGGTDDFEPKLSLVPLMFGTLKGTIYSLILAIPLGVLGGMYTSQFMHPSLRNVVKPTVEIMAALPSVVLGFLAGLWLAPRLEYHLLSLLLMGFMLPVTVLAAWAALRALPPRWGRRLTNGGEIVVYMVALVLGAWAGSRAGAWFEALAFEGGFLRWLLDATGLAYDQRNAVVVGIAMGFAVIPVIFAIAEDAFSNVPRNLVSASLALGANRWQTVTRVVLPTASAGIFSAVMIGFGRAVGETMIVLMATGNTPLMDWNPFNGFRTLSANIAVEIPEAPHGGTLYRTLFLAALILFVFTFAINTVAEIVRQRLRRRYAEG
jgi:phosphate transport system permease protein